MSQQDQTLWYNCAMCGQPYRPVTPAPPEASHRALRELAAKWSSDAEHGLVYDTRHYAPKWLAMRECARELLAALSTGTETKEPTETPRG